MLCYPSYTPNLDQSDSGQDQAIPYHPSYTPTQVRQGVKIGQNNVINHVPSNIGQSERGSILDTTMSSIIYLPTQGSQTEDQYQTQPRHQSFTLQYRAVRQGINIKHNHVINHIPSYIGQSDTGSILDKTMSSIMYPPTQGSQKGDQYQTKPCHQLYTLQHRAIRQGINIRQNHVINHIPSNIGQSDRRSILDKTMSSIIYLPTQGSQTGDQYQTQPCHQSYTLQHRAVRKGINIRQNHVINHIPSNIGQSDRGSILDKTMSSIIKSIQGSQKGDQYQTKPCHQSQSQNRSDKRSRKDHACLVMNPKINPMTCGDRALE